MSTALAPATLAAIPTAGAAVWTGLVGLAVAMGIGRFAFTPLLPLMQQDAGVSLVQGSWLATANYVGYLVGALICISSPPAPARAIQWGLVSIACIHSWHGTDARILAVARSPFSCRGGERVRAGRRVGMGHACSRAAASSDTVRTGVRGRWRRHLLCRSGGSRRGRNGFGLAGDVDQSGRDCSDIRCLRCGGSSQVTACTQPRWRDRNVRR